MEPLVGIVTLPPVPVYMTLEADEWTVSSLLTVRAVVAAFSMVRIRPSVPPAIPVRVWAEAPLKRSKAPVTDKLLILPVVVLSAACWKATLPALVTVKLLEAVVAPCSAMPPEPAAIATPPVLLALPIVVIALPLTLMLVAPRILAVELALPRETVPL